MTAIQLVKWVIGTLYGILLLALIACAVPAAPPAAAPSVPPPTTAAPASPVPAATAAAPSAAAPTAVSAPTAVPATAQPTTASVAAAMPLENVRLSINSRLTNLDPATALAPGGFMALFLCGTQLFRINDDFSTTPYLAEKIESSADGLTQTVTIRADAKYADGTPVTAEDVAFAYQRNVELKGPRLFLLGPVESATATDERTVVFKLKEPYSNFQIGLADHGFTIFPKAKIQEDKDFFLHPLCSGQYILKDWTPGSGEWVFEENPNHFGGPSMIKRIEFVAVPDITSRVLQLTTGALDYAYDIPAAIRADLPAEVQTYVDPYPGMFHLAFNLSKEGPWQDPKVRQAISLAIDRDTIAQRAFFGTSRPATSFLYPGPAETIDVLPNGGKRDLAAAKELLATTPYASGFKMQIQPWGQRPGWTDAALVIKENLAELGIEVEVTPVDDSTALANLAAGTYEAQFAANAQDPLTFLKGQFGDGGFWTTRTQYSNPELNQLLIDAGAATDAQARADLYAQIQTLALEDMPLVPVSERVVVIGSRVDRDILYEQYLPPGFNPRVATVEEYLKSQ